MAKAILFIEDESTLQKTFGKLLRQEGYKMISATDGESGFRTAKEQQPDLIILDLILPKMNGFEVLASLKKEEETKKIPVIILTNLERMADIDKALELGATTYLVKVNYSLDDVLKKIEATLKKTTD